MPLPGRINCKIIYVCADCHYCKEYHPPCHYKCGDQGDRYISDRVAERGFPEWCKLIEPSGDTYPKTNQEIIEYFVCGQCGGNLSLIDIKDEGEQAWCSECQKTHTGVMPEVYKLAKEYCDTHFFQGCCLWSIDPDLNKRLAVREMCDIVKWVWLQTGGKS